MAAAPWRRLPALFALAVLGAIVLLGVLAPVLYPAGPWPNVGDPLIAPFTSQAVPLGTDTLGRDVAAELVHGARVSLIVGVVATAAALLIGVGVGAVAGYARGWVDNVLMRFTELFQAVPSFILLIVLVVLLGPSIATIITGIAVVSWPPIARLVRGEFLSLATREFVQSCRLLGVTPLRIIFFEILPNCVAPIIVAGSIMVASAILLEAGLSFLGLGDPNVISWGAMVATGRPLLRSATYLSVIPGLAILLTVLSINLFGEALNEALSGRRRP
jgi:peptide/nickel transport system permease protein